MGLISKTIGNIIGNKADKGFVVNGATYNSDMLMEYSNCMLDGEFLFGSKSDMAYDRYVGAYLQSPTISAVINYHARIFTNGDTWILRRDGKQKGEEVKGGNADKLRRLLEQPNKYDTQTQFETKLLSSVLLFGWCIIYIDKPIGFRNIDANEMRVIPPSRLYFEYYENVVAGAISWDSIRDIYILSENGKERRRLVKDNCHLIKDSTPSFYLENFLPISRIDSIEVALSNEYYGLESRNTLIRERGIRGIITNETSDSNSFIMVSDPEKKEFLGELKRAYGTLKNQFQIAFSNKSLKWQSMSMPMRDLMLLEEDANVVAKICDAYAFPKILLSDGNGQGEQQSNMNTATRNLYLNVTIPMAKDIFEQINRIFDTRSLGFFIERDYTDLPVLQPDRKEYAEAQLRLNQSCNIAFQMNIIDMNEWRKQLGQDPKPEFEGKYFSDIKDLVNASVNIDETQVNDGTSMNTLNNEGTLNQTV